MITCNFLCHYAMMVLVNQTFIYFCSFSRLLNVYFEERIDQLR